MKKLIFALLALTSCNIDEPDNRKAEILIKGQKQEVNFSKSHFYLRNRNYFDFSCMTADAYIFVKQVGNSLEVSKSIKQLDGGYTTLLIDTAPIETYLVYGVTLSTTAMNNKGTSITLTELR